MTRRMACCGPRSCSGYAFDIILFQCKSDPSLVSCSQVLHSFDSSSNSISLEVESANSSQRFSVIESTIQTCEEHTAQQKMKRQEDDTPTDHDTGALQRLVSFLSSSESISSNLVVRSLSSREVLASTPLSLHLWSDEDQIIVVDIDGTITKSNIKGAFTSMFLADYTHVHDGICQFLEDLVSSTDQNQNRRRVLYLSARPIGTSHLSRLLLQNVQQGQHKLPDGPLFGHMGTYQQVLYEEYVKREIFQFKSRTLLDQVVRPWQRITRRKNSNSVLFAGFGNTLMDMQAYHIAGVPLERNYLINTESRLVCLDGKPNSEREGLISHKEYKTRIGTAFAGGYKDALLLRHVTGQDDESSGVV